MGWETEGKEADSHLEHSVKDRLEQLQELQGKSRELAGRERCIVGVELINIKINISIQGP